MASSTSTKQTRPQKVRLISAAVAATLSLAVPAAMIPLAVLSFGAVNDLPEYFAGATLSLSGRGASVYKLPELTSEEHRLFPAMGERAVGLFIPPFSLPLLLPVALMPPPLAPVIWTVLLALAALVSVLMLRKTFQLSLVATLWLTATACLSGPLYESLRIGQLAPILLLCLCLAVDQLKQGKEIKAGLALAVLLLKPQELLPIMLYLIGAAKWKTAGTLLAVGAALVVISLALPGLDGWRSYIALLGDVSQNSVYMQPQLSATVRGQLLRVLFLGADFANLFSLGVLAVTSCFILWSGKRLRGDLHGLLFLALPLGLLSALHCHDYDLILLAPSIVALTKYGPAARIPSYIVLAAIASAGVFMLPFYITIHYDHLLKGGVINPQFVALLIWSLGLAAFAFKQMTLPEPMPESQAATGAQEAPL